MIKVVNLKSNDAIKIIKDAIVEDNAWKLLWKRNFKNRFCFMGIVDEEKKTFRITLQMLKGNFFYKALNGRIEDIDTCKSNIIYYLGWPYETKIIFICISLLFCFGIINSSTTILNKFLLIVLLVIILFITNILSRMLNKNDEQKLLNFLDGLLSK